MCVSLCVLLSADYQSSVAISSGVNKDCKVKLSVLKDCTSSSLTGEYVGSRGESGDCRYGEPLKCAGISIIYLCVGVCRCM